MTSHPHKNTLDKMVKKWYNLGISRMIPEAFIMPEVPKLIHVVPCHAASVNHLVKYIYQTLPVPFRWEKVAQWDSQSLCVSVRP